MCTKFRKNLRKWVFTKQFYWGTADTTAHVENGVCDRFGIMPWTSTAAQRMTHAQLHPPHPHPPPTAVRRCLLNAVLRTGSEQCLRCWGAAGLRGRESGPWSMAWTGGGWRAASDSDGPLKGHEQDKSLDALIFQKRHSGLCVDSLSSDGDLVGGCSLEVVAQDRASFLCKLGCAPWSTSWGPVLYFPGRWWRWLETMNALGVWVSVSASSAWFWRYCSYASALLLLHVGVLWLSLGFYTFGVFLSLVLHSSWLHTALPSSCCSAQASHMRLYL